MFVAFISAPAAGADELARDLVERRFAACVNRIPCSATYWWDGEIVTDDEVILLAKTSEKRATALESFVLEAHPYEVPCIEFFEPADVLDEYAQWVANETTA